MHGLVPREFSVAHSLCVFCSSSEAVDGVYVEAAERLGRALGEQGGTLIYGGGNIGLMGRVALATHATGGRVVGVIPRFMEPYEVAYEAADELIWTDTMRQRKALMEQRAEAFVALPGGFGTLEELAEILALKQLRQTNKPLVLLNTAGFYDPLLAFFERLYALRFTKARHRAHYHVITEPRELWPFLDGYEAAAVETKWG